MWHTETDIFALILFVIMLVKQLRKETQDRQDKVLIGVLAVCILNTVVDYVSSEEMNRQDSWMLYQLSLTAYYTLMPSVTAAWMFYLIVLITPENTRQFYVRTAAAMLPVALYMIAAASNPMNGGFFTLSRDMVYARGPLFWPLGIGFYTAYSLSGLAALLINYRKVTPQSNKLFLFTYFFFSIVFIFVQIFHPGWLVEKLTYAVLYIFCDATVEEEKRQQFVCTIRKQNIALRANADAANAASRAKSDFLSRMSHDIRTPLNGIIGMTYIAKMQQNPPVTADSLDKIDTSSRFLLSLVNDVLDMSKMESRKMELHPEPYPYEEFCGYLNAVIRPLCDEKHQHFILETDPVGGYTPVVDIMRLNQIYFNLLSNAVKFTPEGGEIRLKIHEDPLPDSRMRFTMTVSDSGIGMSREFQKQLFEPFTQENRNDTSAARGTGLGLAIVRKTVEAMGGTISVESEINRGTCFTVIITSACIRSGESGSDAKEETGAAGKAVSPEAEAPGVAAAGEHAALKGKVVLLCEDHPLNQEIAAALLKQKGMITEVAEDGKQGVEAFRKSSIHYYDCILMDIRMPVMDGYEATREIRALSRPDAGTVPIIAMTADAFSEDIQKCLDAGMNRHLAKPIEPEKLYRTLEEEIHS